MERNMIDVASGVDLFRRNDPNCNIGYKFSKLLYHNSSTRKVYEVSINSHLEQ